MKSQRQTLLDAGLNIFGADLLCESLLRAPWVAELHQKGDPLRLNFPVNRTDCAGWVGVSITLQPVREWVGIQAEGVSGETQILVDAAVKAERDRICDLFLTEPISFPVGINTDADEIDASIKSDRFKLMTSVREGKPFKAVLDEVVSGDALKTDDAEMLGKARALVIEHQKASISLVQRTLKIRYNQAARLLESLEVSGVIGPMDANGRRVVMVKGGA